MIMKLKLASVSPGRVGEIQIAGPTARGGITTVQEAHFEDLWSRESQRAFHLFTLGPS